ncbi:GAF domain-containing protein [Pseudothermotoga sp.]|nr:GAF domain-containing protein [Pseudothermotoga sp.]MCX7813611.1 GAF domain-containing protein [Pseudothermotoga sp.]MDW8139985.1 GAF domain-containing protein [Pseudothermotoga sp.]
MRKVVQNIADDFFEILHYDKNQWPSYWKIYRAKHEPLIDEYEKTLNVSEQSIVSILKSMERRNVDRLMQLWYSISHEQKYHCSKLITAKHELFELDHEDFTIVLTGLLGLKDWVVVKGKREWVVLIDLLSLWNKKCLDELSYVAYQAALSFKRGEKYGEYAPKEELFAKLYTKIDRTFEENDDIEKIMQTICRVLYEDVPHYNWVGFYLTDSLKKNELVLGPFVGEPTEHVRIPFGKGICGQAAERKDVFVVQDVSKETNYLSCSPKVQSEIVVPIIVNGEVFGEIDIDSHVLNCFDEEDERLLGYICEKISQRVRVKR